MTYGFTYAGEVQKTSILWKKIFPAGYDEELQMAYVHKVKDELTKNHEDMEIDVTSGFMTQVIAADGRPHKLCPV